MAFSLDTRTDLTEVWRHRPSLEGFNHDGLELACLRRHRREWPLREAGMFLLVVLSFALLLHLDLDRTTYEVKVFDLRADAELKRVASHVMQLDPMSHWLVTGLQHGRW